MDSTVVGSMDVGWNVGSNSSGADNTNVYGTSTVRTGNGVDSGGAGSNWAP